jgi:hypothetical protein
VEQLVIVALTISGICWLAILAALYYAAFVRGVYPAHFRRALVARFTEEQGWDYTIGQPPDEGTKPYSFVELELRGRFRARAFHAEQTLGVREDISHTGGSTSKTTHRSRATELTLTAVDQFPEGHIRLHRIRGKVSVRKPDNRGLADALAGSAFERWLSARRVRGGSLTVGDRTISTRWGGGIYRARLLRKLDFLHEAAQHLTRTLDEVDPDWRVNRLPADTKYSGKSPDKK